MKVGGPETLLSIRSALSEGLKRCRRCSKRSRCASRRTGNPRTRSNRTVHRKGMSLTQTAPRTRPPPWGQQARWLAPQRPWPPRWPRRIARRKKGRWGWRSIGPTRSRSSTGGCGATSRCSNRWFFRHASHLRPPRLASLSATDCGEVVDWRLPGAQAMDLVR